MTVDARSFRDALARFASGVCVLTTVGGDGRRVGVTISAFSSLSLDPPLVLFCIGKRSANLDAWLNGDRFTVNVLGEGQAALSELFASQRENKFAGVAGHVGGNGCFVIAGALVSLACRRVSLYDEGDHFIVVGEIEDVELGPNDGPLLRFRAAYRRMAAIAGEVEP